MATSSKDNATEGLSLCSICVDRFKTPRSLPCLHSFCHNCLLTYIVNNCRSTEPRLGFNCPLCRSYVPSDGAFDKPEEWAANFPVNGVLERITGISDERLCAACLRDNETETATGICLSCMEYLCAVCTKHHKKHLPSRGHTVCDLEEVKSRNVAQGLGKYFRCPEHNENNTLFCNDHEQPCCLICTGTVGSKHRKCESVDSVHLATLAVRENGKLDSLLTEVRIIEKKLSDAKEEQEKYITELEDSVDEIITETEKEFKELVDHIEKLKNKHLEEIQMHLKKGREEENKCISTINDGIQCVNYCCQSIGKARGTENDNQILLNYYSAKEKVAQLKQFNFAKKHVKISEEKEPILEEVKNLELLGAIEYSESKHHVILDVRAIELLLISEFRIEDGNLFTGVFLENGTFATINHVDDGQCFIYDQNWTQIQVIEGLQKPFEVLQHADELFVTCENSESIEVFSATDYKRLRTIPMNESVFGIASHGGMFYIACATKIIKTDTSGNKIREYEAEGGNNVCIVITSEGLIVYSNWCLHTVTAVTEQGEIAWKYESDDLKEPTGLDKDSFSNIFVAAVESNNIHVLACTGELIRIFEDMSYPAFIKMHEKRDICCVCCNHEVIKVYQL